jgi:antitoxin component YwqK of YwqJK toxin-antitoxin module
MRIFGLLILCFIFINCTKNKKIEERNQLGKLITSYSINTETNNKNGEFLKYDNGILVEKAVFFENILVGERTVYYSDGNVHVIENRDDKGIFNGVFKSFYPNGVIESMGQYANNVMVGKWKGNYTNGKTKEIVTFENNEENGPFVEYYENGKLKAEGNYKDGDFEQGLLKMYDESGRKTREMNCEHGRCQTIWNDSISKKIEKEI